MIFKIILVQNLTSIFYAYDIENPMVSYEKRMPLLVQLPSPDEIAKYLDGNRMHKFVNTKTGCRKKPFQPTEIFLVAYRFTN